MAYDNILTDLIWCIYYLLNMQISRQIFSCRLLVVGHISVLGIVYIKTYKKTIKNSKKTYVFSSPATTTTIIRSASACTTSVRAPKWLDYLFFYCTVKTEVVFICLHYMFAARSRNSHLVDKLHVKNCLSVIRNICSMPPKRKV